MIINLKHLRAELTISMSFRITVIHSYDFTLTVGITRFSLRSHAS